MTETREAYTRAFKIEAAKLLERTGTTQAQVAGRGIAGRLRLRQGFITPKCRACGFIRRSVTDDGAPESAQ